MDNKQRELKATVLWERYDIVIIMEVWWDDSRDWGAAVDGYSEVTRTKKR